MLKIIDQYVINFVDSAAANRMKTGTGAGESRLYLGQMSKKDVIYSFFSEDVRFYFVCKSEILRYLRIAKYEYMHPSQDYQNKTSFPSYFNENVSEIDNLPDVYFKFNFIQNHDSSRCFIRLDDQYPNAGKNYDILRKVCIPVLTKIVFIKYIDTNTNLSYIQVMPKFNRQYTEKELGLILADRYNSEESPKKPAIYLFAFDFARYIIGNKLSTSKIIVESSLHDSYKIELDNALAIYYKMVQNDYQIEDLQTIIMDYRSTDMTIPQPQDTDKITSDYRPYITAIKSKPFLLLAGISGTGKSRIVRELARACWDADSEEYKAHKPSNFEMVQVKPNWHDSSELIGYVSRVSGEPIYVAGPFLKFVAKAWENPDVPYFLCLDEMNLAPVEQYFAEYLSVVESRKVEDGVAKTDPILPKSKEDWFRVLTAELTLDDTLREQFLEDGICIPQNLIVVGTVNMDETTFSFSRKVLDRAMTIEMNEVNLTCGLDKRHETIGKLDKSHLIGTAVEGCDVYNAYKADCDTAIAYLNAINQHLEKTPFKVAYRTRNEFLLYVVNNLPYNKDKDGKDVQHGWLLARALDEITCMKVLSRIEGDETKVSKEFLSELTKEIKAQLESLGECTYTAIRAEENKENNVWYSKSLDKLDEMTKRLESGYTSFWS